MSKGRLLACSPGSVNAPLSFLLAVRVRAGQVRTYRHATSAERRKVAARHDEGKCFPPSWGPFLFPAPPTISARWMDEGSDAIWVAGHGFCDAMRAIDGRKEKKEAFLFCWQDLTGWPARTQTYVAKARRQARLSL